MNNLPVIIDWQEPAIFRERLEWSRALYAILHPETDEILYLGKADGCTVLDRWNADDKHDRVWSALKANGIHIHKFIVGGFCTQQRLTRELLSDVESLLIYWIKP